MAADRRQCLVGPNSSTALPVMSARVTVALAARLRCDLMSGSRKGEQGALLERQTRVRPQLLCRQIAWLAPIEDRLRDASTWKNLDNSVLMSVGALVHGSCGCAPSIDLFRKRTDGRMFEDDAQWQFDAEIALDTRHHLRGQERIAS
jgi:hypothetical protein